MAAREWSAVLEAPGRLVLRQFDVPRIGPEDALLRVERAGVCGSDPKFYHGNLHGYTLPIILGHEEVGTIEDIGETAAQWYGVKKGDRVIVGGGGGCGHCYYCLKGQQKFCQDRRSFATCCDVPPHLWGAYGQYMYLPPNAAVYKVPPEISPEAAVLLNAVIANGIQWTRMWGGTSIGDTVVIQGPGPQGLAAVIAARESGAGAIIVTGLPQDHERLRLAREFGAHYAVDVEKNDLAGLVSELTEGRGADVVVDVTGSPRAILTSIELVRKGGTMVQAGVTGATTETPVRMDTLLFKEIKLQSVFTNSPEATRAAIKLAASKRYALEKIVTHKFPLARAEHAVKTAGGEIPGESPIKVIIDPWME
ncbi:MAG: zinc-binding dehydrogenase [Chloroflexi bacterium]|nr:zinc-binding dehydrogenase [Chloroflexota bacterium]